MPIDRRDPSTAQPTLLDVPDGRTGIPHDLAPMRPRLASSAFNSPDHLFELKWDGLRAFAARDRDGLRITDRSGGDLLRALPELAELPIPEGALVDGEIVVCDSRGRPSYELLAGRLGPRAAKRGRGPLFVAFDLLYEQGRPLLAKPLEERRRRLLALELRGRTIGVPEHLEADGEPFLEVIAEHGLEGIVAKRRTSTYLPGARTSDWLKCHVTPRSDVVLGGLAEDDTHAALRALCGRYSDNGTVVFAGEAAVPTYLGRWLDEATRAFTADASPFALPIPLRASVRWLRPRLVAIVEHAGERGSLRDARFRALRFDGKLEDCRLEEPVDVTSAAPSADRERPRLVLLQSLHLG